MDGSNQGCSGDKGTSPGPEHLEPASLEEELESVSIVSAAAAYNMHHLAEEVRRLSSRPPSNNNDEENEEEHCIGA